MAMRDDTKGDDAESGHFEFSSKINAILEHRIHRKSAVQWARNLRFLTFANDEVDAGVEKSSDFAPTKELRQGQCTRCEQRVPPPAGHICATHTLLKNDIKASEKQLKEYADPCTHVEDASCEDCLHMPLFPNHGKITRFRIRRLKPKDTKASELSTCTHFVAVSYCWSSQSARKPTGSKADDEQLQVLEEDGITARPTRAPRDTIDRAVKFAAENGLRMIWIDQECIEQDNEDEKELGIQAMDYVFARAHVSIGLFQAMLQQRHLDALLLFFEWKIGGNLKRRGPRPLKQCRNLRLDTLAEALSIVAEDRWNTRSWILQEAFVSGGYMVLLFPRAKDVSVKGWSLICHDRSLTEISIQLDILQSCLEQSSAFFTSSPQTRISTKLPRWAETLDQLRWFQPKDKLPHSVNIWINDFKPRRTCNAAMALCFLKRRNNDRVADRLAIIANLCNYRLRLNTVKLEKSQSRLSVCILALAIANGDFSLLSPEIYYVPRELNITHSQRNHDFTWAPSSMKQLNHIEANTTNPIGLTLGRESPITYRLTNEGLSLIGFLWKIDRFVGLASIKHNYGESWSKLWCSSAKGEERSLGATEEGYRHQLKQQISRKHWLAITHILFEVLILLRAQDELAAADAIWHSVLNARWDRYLGEQKGAFPETVVDFPEQLRVENCQGMFQLERSPDGAYHHKWLIDRIMLQGGFWLGRLVELSSDQEYTERCSAHPKQPEGNEYGSVSAEEPVISAIQDRQQRQNSHSSTQETALPSEEEIDTVAGSMASAADDTMKPSDQQPTPESAEWPLMTNGPHSQHNRATAFESLRKSDHRETKLKEKGHFQNQFSFSIMLKIYEWTMMENTEKENDGRNDVDDSLRFSPEGLMGLTASVHHMDGRNSEGSLRQQRGIFDIDGDTSGRVLVLTPFQQHMETVPRPESRSMSGSWVVQPTSQPGESEDDAESEVFKGEFLRTTGMVRGMWKLMVQPPFRYNLV